MKLSGGATHVAHCFFHIYTPVPRSEESGDVSEQPHLVPRDIASNIFRTLMRLKQNFPVTM